MSKKIVLVSRCAWTLYNFRAGLMRALKAKNHTVLCGGARGGGFGEKIRAMNISFKPLPLDMKGLNPFSDLKFFFTLFFWYRKNKPDIVHHFTIKPVIYGTVAAMLAKTPKIINTITGLGYVFTGAQSRWLRWFVEFLYRVSLSWADFTFFLNASDLDFFVSRGMVKPEKAGLLPGEGVDCAHFDPNLFDGPNPDEPPMVLMVARLLRDKGVYEFVDAARLAKQSLPHAKFCLLGDRDEQNPTVVDEKDLATWQKQGLVSWLGTVEDVRPLIAKASVVVLPSHREGAPRSLLEASAMRRPVVATDVVGCRDVVEHKKNGLLVPKKDAGALFLAIREVLETPDLANDLGANGRARVLREFSEEIVIDNIFKIYDE